jgi:bacillithiol biosynthesis cysteine-adding enzyme BshC
MRFSEAPRSEFKQFSAFSTAFADQNSFVSLLNRPLNSIADLAAQAKEKLSVYSKEHRSTLVSEWKSQIEKIASESQLKNLELLSKENTVTITTGHQLTFAGGPLYLVYKVLHAAKLVEQFNADSKDIKAVPVFWMASEDHDHEEIKSAHLFGQTISWETEQTGPVGRMSTSDLNESWNQLKAFFEGKEPKPEIAALLNLDLKDTYADFTQEFLTRLFANYGVLVLQPDTHNLKKLFIPVLEKELESDASFQAVQDQNQKLEALGFSAQAVSRSCNLFLLKEGKRSRIDRVDNGFAADGEVFSETQMMKMVAEQPESFSPNVILRPVYQETILPNICYVGGGGEMAYWLQLKGVFESKNTLFPIIAQRNSVILVDQNTTKKLDALNLTWQDFAGDKELLKKEMLQKWSSGETDFSAIQSATDKLKSEMHNKAAETDKSLESFAEAEMVRLQKQIENFEQRVLKQVKQKNEVQLKQLDGLGDKLFPSGGLQERYFHWLHFAPSGNYKPLFAAIYEGLEPLNANLLAIRC